jgi:small subunit ribosomal protein S21
MAPAEGRLPEGIASGIRRRNCPAGTDEHPTRQASKIDSDSKEDFVVKLKLREGESVQEAVRRFRKLVERSGIKKEMRRREYYEKPSDIRRRAKIRAERRARRNRQMMGR